MPDKRCLPVVLSNECNFYAFFNDNSDRIIIGPHYQETIQDKFRLTERCPGPLVITVTKRDSCDRFDKLIKIELCCAYCGYQVTTDEYFWFDGYQEMLFAFSRWFAMTESPYPLPLGKMPEIPYKRSPSGKLFCLYTHTRNLYLVLLPNRALQPFAWQGTSIILNNLAEADGECRTKKKKGLGF
ncbi:MAG: hypothetical protein V1668_01285 [Patescibacteria group bacterium]